MPFKSHIRDLIQRPDETAGIDYFRERLLFYLLVSIAGFGAIAYLPSIYYGLDYGYYGVVVVDTLALAWVFFLISKKTLAFNTRCHGLLGGFYILGVWLLVSLGPTGAGFMWMLLFSVMAGVLLGFRSALASLGLNAITIGLMSILVLKKIIAWELIPGDAIAIWTVKGMNFLSVNAILSVSTGFLINRISWMARKEQQRSQALAEEMEARLLAEKEKKELTARLYQSQKMEAMGTLAGGVAHDFNNILSTIMGYTELTLAETRLPEPARENLEQVIRAAERARGISHQILTFSRHAPALKSPADLGHITRECIDFFRISIPAGITLTSAIPDEPFPILADKNQIHQVIMNLLTNGLHALAPDSQKAQISISLGAADPKALEDSGKGEPVFSLTVSDTGNGIDPELADRIFEPYFTTKETGKGTGMGLSISQGIVRDHGGEILVSSTPDQGSTFTVLLPGHDTAVALTRVSPGRSRGGNEHILMVDDDKDVCNAQKRILAGLGYRVTALKDPMRVPDLLASDPSGFHLLVTDRKMDGISGADLCRNIKMSHPGLPVMLCTGFPEKADEDLFDAILVKPVKGKDLAAAIRQVLDRQPNP